MARAEPVGDLNHAWSYLRAAEHLYECIRSGALDLAFPSPVRLLAGHAIELLCKSYLRYCGWDEKACIRLGHDLEALLDAVDQQGLAMMLSDHERDHILLLNQEFSATSKYAVRYLQTGVCQLPNCDVLFCPARRLMDKIEPYLAPQRIRNVGLRTELEPWKSNLGR